MLHSGLPVVPLHILKRNTVPLVAYIDKVLKTGPDGMVLHGLVQLHDYLTGKSLSFQN